MNQLKRFGVFFLLGLSLLLAGCFASAPKAYVSNDGMTMVMPKVISAGSGREMLVMDACPIDKVADLKQREKIAAGDAPLPTCKGASEVQTAHGTTLVRDIAAGTVPVVTGAIIQGKFAKDAAKAGSCSGDKCTGGGVNTTQNTVINLCTATGGPCGR